MNPDYAAQCRFFSAEDACRIALQAYYSATRHITPPPGEPWYTEDGAPWASATDFAEAFNGELQARLALLALDRLGEFYPVSVQWHLLKIACDIEPEKISPLLAKHEAEVAAINAEFSGLEMNHLPPADNHTHNAETEVGDYA
ncbi:hypothetical protein [Frateuria defendens]|uniref:hypothetical protein n=1 Tax=Frateuria defendens TaxID=2219559 RepID=UPI00066FE180|nr:hypothetical protein [Frateuria defendens]